MMRHEEGEKLLLHFSVGSSRFAIPLEDVREVSEFLPVRCYPVPVKGHLGVINLRGNVIPLLSMASFLGDSEIEKKLLSSASKDQRMIVLTSATDETQPFAILSSSVKKVPEASLRGSPVQILDRQGFLSMLEAA